MVALTFQLSPFLMLQHVVHFSVQTMHFKRKQRDNVLHTSTNTEHKLECSTILNTYISPLDTVVTNVEVLASVNFTGVFSGMVGRDSAVDIATR